MLLKHLSSYIHQSFYCITLKTLSNIYHIFKFWYGHFFYSGYTHWKNFFNMHIRHVKTRHIKTSDQLHLWNYRCLIIRISYICIVYALQNQTSFNVQTLCQYSWNFRNKLPPKKHFFFVVQSSLNMLFNIRPRRI